MSVLRLGVMDFWVRFVIRWLNVTKNFRFDIGMTRHDLVAIGLGFSRGRMWFLRVGPEQLPLHTTYIDLLRQEAALELSGVEIAYYKSGLHPQCATMDVHGVRRRTRYIKLAHWLPFGFGYTISFPFTSKSKLRRPACSGGWTDDCCEIRMNPCSMHPTIDLLRIVPDSPFLYQEVSALAVRLIPHPLRSFTTYHLTCQRR